NYNLIQQNDSSYLYFRKAQTIGNTQSVKPNTKGWINYALANTYYEENQLDSAVYYAEKSMEYFKNPFSFDNLDASRLLYKSYLKTEDFKKAAHYFQHYDSIRDSLNITEKLTNVERLKLEQFYQEKESLQALQQNQQKSKL